MNGPSLTEIEDNEALGTAADEPDLHSRCAMLAARGLSHGEGLNRVVDALAHLAQSNPLGADRIAEACVVLADSANPSLLGRVQYQWAQVKAVQGRLDDALRLIDEARMCFINSGDLLKAIRTHLGRMHVLDDCGRHRDAVEVGRVAIATLEALRVTEADGTEQMELALWLRAALHENVGVAHGFLDAHESALEAYTIAESTYHQLGLESDLGRLRANRAVELVACGRASEALEVFDGALAQFKADGNLVWYGKCLGHQAAANLQLGRFAEALAALEDARRLLDDLGVDAEASRLVSVLAQVSLGLSLDAEAVSLAARAATAFREAGMTADLARALNCCAVVHTRQARLNLALTTFDEAIALLEQVGATASASEATLARAEVLRRLNRHDEARMQSLHACDRLLASDSVAHQGLALISLSDLSNAEEAHQHLLSAEAIIDELRMPHLAWQLQLRLGRSHRRNRDTAAARAHLTAAVEILETIRTSVPNGALQAIFLGDKRDAFDELVLLLLALPDPDISEAFAVCERTRAVVAGTIPGALPAPERAKDEKLDRLSRDLSQAYSHLQSANSPASGRDRGDLEADATAVEREIGLQLMRTLPRLGNEAGPERRVLPTMTTTTQVSVAYEVLGETVHAFVVRDGVLAHRLLPATTSQVVGLLAELDRQWSACQVGPWLLERNGPALRASAEVVLQDLFRCLVASIEDLIGYWDHLRQIEFKPSGPLCRVPFHALHDGASALIDRVSVSLGLSGLTMATRKPRSEGADERPVLAVGISDPDIPRASSEAHHVASIFNHAVVLTGPEATVASFRQHAPTARLIHLACHGLHRQRNPLFSALRLADGWITARDIMEMRLDGATVVLSACESGKVGLVTSEPLGLSWAFLVAGASTVIVSLWTVRDDVAASVMSSFYDEIGRGVDQPRALQLAQQRAARSWPHPFHWAPFALIGTSVQHRRGDIA